MVKKRKSPLDRKLPVNNLNNQILKHLAANPTKKYNGKQIIEKLRISNTREQVNQLLIELEKKGLIIHNKEGQYHWNKANTIEASHHAYDTKTFIGEIDIIKSGAAYVIIPEEDQDVYIPSRYINGAMNRDTVKVEVPQIKSKRKPEGKVVEIVKRYLTKSIGTLRLFNQYAIVFPELANQFPEVLIKLTDTADAKDGDNVVVNITKWGAAKSKAIWGEVTSILDKNDDNDIAMNSILMSNGFDLEFPEAVLNEAMLIDTHISQKEIDKRRDCRSITTFTIDPDTAKDFDDALSYYEDKEKNTIEIGVHIADVTHYVKENSALDKEALKRSTSVYLVDRVCPMLPEKLSNDLCSLNPHEDKFTFSAIFTFDSKFKIINRWFGKTIIHSDHRFTYEDAQKGIETKEGEYAYELEQLNKIAYKLRKDRFKNGSINFESEEIKFILDEKNKPIGVFTKERKDAHLLVEDFMLLANKEVATYMYKKAKPEIPYIYRIHDEPDITKILDFALFAKEMGFQMKVDSPANIVKSFNLLAEAKIKNPTLKMLEPLAIRTMAKAEYSSNNIGHFGLAFEYYSHFTSPIRRYSDVIAHRVLFENLNDSTYRVDKELLEARCKHISKQERKAMDAERESTKYKQVEFMLDKVGQEFDGTITGMIERGLFVEVLDVKAEGMIPFRYMDEPYTLAPSKLKAISKISGREIKMGEKIKVRLVDADLTARQLEFRLVEEG
jgi:ribonuclease R